MSSALHKPVLLREVLQFLDLRPGLVVVDGTVGAGGHSRAILERIEPDGVLIGLDRDPMMLGLAGNVLTGPRCHLRQASYAELPEILETLDIEAVDRILVDLGLSSDQLADEERGFGFQSEGPLDLRFDPTRGQPAWELLQTINEQELERILREFGEERFSVPIAGKIVEQRINRPVRTARDLVDRVLEAIPRKFQREARKQPATRVFQALRIAVNEELNHLQTALDHSFFESLAPGGRLVVLTFHSLEDRLVKNAFRGETRWRNLTPKPITATPTEQRLNPRSRTAKLRAAIKQ